MLGDKIRFYRDVLHISQEQLAERVGVPCGTVAMWENNQLCPTAEQAGVLAQLFGISKDYLTVSNEPKVAAAPVAQPVARPVVAPQPTPVAQPVARPVVAPQPTPVAQPVARPVVAPQPTPVAQPVARPVVAPQPTPVAQPVARPVVAPQPTPVAQPVVRPVVAPQPTPVAQPVARPVVAPQPTPVAQPVARPVVAPQPTPAERVVDELESEPTIVRPGLSKSAPFQPIPVKEDGTPIAKSASVEVAIEKAEKEKEKKKNSNFKIVIIACAVVIAILLAVILFFVLREPVEPEAPPVNTNTDVALTAEDIYEMISPSVVEITAESSTMISTGTGFFCDDNGTVVTNYHVIEDCQTAYITLADGSTYDVISVMGYDAGRDIAILKTSCNDSEPLESRSSAVSTGESVYVLGSSLGLTGSLSDGIISAVDREVDGYLYLQTTAPISSGNSGGPLVDSNGKVIGIVCASFDDGQNLNLAIPINDLDTISRNENVTLEELFPEVPQGTSEVEWLDEYRFQYYDDEDVYVLLFELSDVNEVPLAASGSVEIMIINDDGIVVYEQTHRFSESNFEEWLYGEREMYLCTIYIAPEDILAGSTADGTCYFDVAGNGYYFETCTYDVDDLPTE